MGGKNPSTLPEAVVYFSDFDNAQEFLIALAQPDRNVSRPCCGSKRVNYLEIARLWKCYAKQNSLSRSESSSRIHLGLDKWLSAIWLIVERMNGISRLVRFPAIFT